MRHEQPPQIALGAADFAAPPRKPVYTQYGTVQRTTRHWKTLKDEIEALETAH